MIRALVSIAVGGAVVSAACLTAAVAIGGPDAIAHGGWMWRGADSWGQGWSREWRFSDDGGPATTPAASRDFPWSGGAVLTVDAPAEVRYVQAAGPAKLTISGDADQLDVVRVTGGDIALPGRRFPHPLYVVLTAPGVNRFELNGASKLDVADFKQDQLTVQVSGHARVVAAGEAQSVTLDISGAGKANLADLKTRRAEIDISGAGKATAAPTEWARVRISGAGDVDFTTRPKQLETHISGFGHVTQPDADDVDDPDPDSGPKRPT